MGWLERIRTAWAAAKFDRDIRSGRRTWGRQPGDADLTAALGGAGITVAVPVEASISAKVIRADGSVEARGEISRQVDAEIDAAILAAMAAQATEDPEQ